MSAPAEDNRGKERLYRFSLYVKRRDGMTEDEFNHHWSTSHPPLVKEWMKKYGVVKYVQYHTPPSLQKATLDIWPDLSDFPQQPYDGVVEITVKSVQDFYDARQDPYYKEHVIPDEEKMIQRGPGQMSWIVGWEEVYIDEQR